MSGQPQSLVELGAEILVRLFALFLIGLPAWHLLRRRRTQRRQVAKAASRLGGRLSVVAALLLAAHGGHAQGRPPAGAETVQSYDTTNVAWTLPPGMSHKTARQAVATLSKLGASLNTGSLNAADSMFLYRWMPGILLPARPKKIDFSSPTAPPKAGH